MTTEYRDSKVLPYTPEQMFDLVMDVRSYPDFLPWCQRLRVIREYEKHFYAELMVGFRGFSGKFVSHVEHNRDLLTVDVHYETGPLKHLENNWRFYPHEEGCKVDFYINFEFKSSLFQSMTSFFFKEVASIMMTSFVDRAANLYGK